MTFWQLHRGRIAYYAIGFGLIALFGGLLWITHGHFSNTSPHTLAAQLGATPEGKIAALIGLVFGFLILLSLAYDSSLFGSRLGVLGLFALAIKKAARPWGAVYNTVTKEPISGVSLQLVDTGGKVVATSVTDINGRYNFIVPAGDYMMRPVKNEYIFPALRLSHVGEDEIYDDLYFGNYFNVKKDGGVIAKNIPMDPAHFNAHAFATQEGKRFILHTKLNRLFLQIADLLFLGGFLYAVVAIAHTPVLYNFIVLVLYICMFGLRQLYSAPAGFGAILDAKTRAPLPFAIIRVYGADNHTEVVHKIATSRGQFFCLVPNGEYVVMIEKRGPDNVYKKVFTSGKLHVTKGVLKEMFFV